MVERLVSYHPSLEYFLVLLQYPNWRSDCWLCCHHCQNCPCPLHCLPVLLPSSSCWLSLMHFSSLIHFLSLLHKSSYLSDCAKCESSDILQLSRRKNEVWKEHMTWFHTKVMFPADTLLQLIHWKRRTVWQNYFRTLIEPRICHTRVWNHQRVYFVATIKIRAISYEYCSINIV
jgi:hypothetical protein